MTKRADEDTRCPVCGRGVIADIAFDAGAATGDGRPFQDPAARQIVEYSCGHRVTGDRLEGADADRLDVERRASEDTVDPPPPAGAP